MNGGWLLVVRAMSRHRLRVLLGLLAVALGMAAILGISIAETAIGSQASAAQAARAGSSDLDVRVSASDALSVEEAAHLGQIRGVAASAPLYEKRVIARDASGSVNGVTVNLVAVNQGGVALRAVSLASGRLPRADSSSEIAIDGTLSTAVTGSGTPLRIGDEIQLTTGTGPDTFTVVGLTAGTEGGPAFTRGAVYIGQAEMLSAFRLGLRTPLVALRLQPGTDPASVAQQVGVELGPRATVVDPRGTAGDPLAGLHPLLLLVSGLSLLVGGGVVMNSVYLAASERRREIGLLRAAGASTAQVVRLFLRESIVTALLAIPVGLAGGALLGAALVGAFAAPDLPAPALGIDWRICVAAAGIAVGIAIIAAALPAFAAGRAPVLTALRPHPSADREEMRPILVMLIPLATITAIGLFLWGGSVQSAAGVGCLLVAAISALPLVAPVVARLLAGLARPVSAQAPTAARTLGRRRNRTALTAGGLGLSIALAVGMSAVTESALSASDGWVSHLFGGDAVITSAVTQTDALADAVGGTPGLTVVSRIRLFGADAIGSEGSQSAVIAALDSAAENRHGALQIDGDRAAALNALAASRPAVIVPAGLASLNGWRSGQTLTLSTGAATVTALVSGIAAHTYPSGDGRETVVMDRAAAIRAFGAEAAGFDLLDVDTHGSPAVAGGAAVRYGMQSESVDELRAAARGALSHAAGILLAASAVAVIIAMLAVIDTLLVNARQGAREIALLRAVGLGRRQALRLGLTEATLLAATGAVCGLAMGAVVIVPLISAAQAPGFDLGYVYPLSTALLVLATVVVASLAAAVLPARRVAGARIADAIRSD